MFPILHWAYSRLPWLPNALPGLLGGIVAGGTLMGSMGIIGIALRIVNPERIAGKETRPTRLFSLTSLLGLVFQVAVFFAMLQWLLQAQAK